MNEKQKSTFIFKKKVVAIEMYWYGLFDTYKKIKCLVFWKFCFLKGYENIVDLQFKSLDGL